MKLSRMLKIFLIRHAESQMNSRMNEIVGGRSNETPLTGMFRNLLIRNHFGPFYGAN